MTLVLAVDGDEVLVLEGVSSLVWTALADPASALELVDQLSPLAPMELDVEPLVADALAQFAAVGLLAPAQPS